MLPHFTYYVSPGDITVFAFTGAPSGSFLYAHSVLDFCVKTQAIDHTLPLLDGERSYVLDPKAAGCWWAALATLIHPPHR